MKGEEKVKRIKKMIFVFIFGSLVFSGCGNADAEVDTQTNNMNQPDYYEEFEGLSEEETTQKLLNEARKQELFIQLRSLSAELKLLGVTDRELCDLVRGGNEN